MGLFSFFNKKPDMPVLRLRNTLSGELEKFEPIGHTVKMYNCGPTVYDRQHIGNLRGAVLANTLKRTLEAWGHKVSHVSNITDVGHLVSDADEGEDKMEAAAKKIGKHTQEIAEEITKLYFADLDLLGINRNEMRFPRAAQYIAEQIALVKALLQKGYAYKISDGVYFDTSKSPGYGKLGGISVSGQQAGARVEENKEKKNPHDFALWKLSKKDEKREQEWQSPWGTGFPGWHLECTAMIFTLLGEQIDIHTGGIEHIPVHHNNEIAQSEAATGQEPFVKFWLHRAHLRVDNAKISKSDRPAIYLEDLIAHSIHPLSFRFWLPTSHYKTPANFTWEAVAGAQSAYEKILSIFKNLPEKNASDSTILDSFFEAINDDLNTPKAITLLKEAGSKSAIRSMDLTLGLDIENMANKIFGDIKEEILELKKERDLARQNKMWQRSDDLRKEIENDGYVLEDSENSSVIRKTLAGIV